MPAKEFKGITISGFLDMKFDDKNRYELVDGIVLMSPRPSEEHMIVQSNIITEINIYFKTKKKNCKAITENQLRVDDYTYIVPDVMVKCFENRVDEPDETPLIVVEVLSPSNMQSDLITKLNKYRDMGIPEYWIINPKSKEITVHYFTSDESVKYYYNDTENRKVISKVVDGMAISIDDLFS